MVKDLVEEMQDEYAQIMKDATETDDYTCEIEVVENEFIKPESNEGKCGGIIMSSSNRLIVCSNALNERLMLCYEEALPVLRSKLFPVK